MCGSDARRILRMSHAEIWRCSARACTLEFAAPQIDEAELQRAYRTFYYPEGSGRAVLEATPESLVEQWLGHLASRFGPVAGRRLLDYGGGSGVLARAATAAGMRVTCIEPDDVARARLIGAGFAAHHDLAELGVDAAFDWILLWDVIEHLRRPWDELRQLAQRLAPAGRIFISTPNAGSLKSSLLLAAAASARAANGQL